MFPEYALFRINLFNYVNKDVFKTPSTTTISFLFFKIPVFNVNALVRLIMHSIKENKISGVLSMCTHISESINYTHVL